MTEELPAEVVDEIGTGLAEVAAEFADELGDPPTLAEFLELLGWAAPGGLAPVRLRGGPQGGESRVPDLGDSPFAEAREALSVLGEVTVDEYAAAVQQVLRAGKVALADVRPENVRVRAEQQRKRVAKSRAGDVVAIPTADGDAFHLAVVITHNRFGMALGLFDGTTPSGRLTAALRGRPRRFPVYTDESLLKNGTWKVVGHDEDLLTLFPADPPIYHRPNAWQGIDTGEFGAAENAEGTMTFIDEREAREVGLADGTYRSTRHAAYLQTWLSEITT